MKNDFVQKTDYPFDILEKKYADTHWYFVSYGGLIGGNRHLFEVTFVPKEGIGRLFYREKAFRIEARLVDNRYLQKPTFGGSTFVDCVDGSLLRNEFANAYAVEQIVTE